MSFISTLFRVGPFDICALNLILLGAIFIVSYLFQKLLQRVLLRTLTQQKIELKGRRENYFRIATRSVYLIALYFSVFSFRINNPNITFEDFIKYDLIDYEYFSLSLYSVLLIVGIFIFAQIAVGVFRVYLSRKNTIKQQRDLGLEFVYVQFFKYVVYCLSVGISIKILGIDLSLILTGSLGLLVGLGLGLQDVFKDTIAGIVLLVEGNIKIGDIVEVNAEKSSNSNKPASNFIARIVKIGVRTTQIQTREGNIQIIPNSQLSQNKVENWSHSSQRSMYTIHVLIEYGSRVELASELMVQAAKSHKMVDVKESPFVRLANFSENGIDLELVFWAKNSWEILNYKSEIRFAIDRLFRENKVHFAFPTRTIINKI